MDNDAIKLLEESSILLLGKAKLRMFGILSYGMSKKIISPEEMTYPKGFPKNPNVMSLSNGKEIKILPGNNVNVSQMNTTIIHQVLHFCSGHLKRKGDKDEIMWTMACDHVANRLLKKLEETTDLVSVPPSSVYFKEIDNSNPEASAEDVYNILMNMRDQKQQSQNNKQKSKSNSPSPSNQSGSSGDNGKKQNNQSKTSPKNKNDDQDGQGGESDANDYVAASGSFGNYTYTVVSDASNQEIEFIYIKNNKTGDVMIAVVDTDTSKMSSQECSQVEKAADEMTMNARTLWHSDAVNKGDLPGEFCSYMNDLFRIRIPWDNILETALLYPVQIQKRRSWSEPNYYIRRPLHVPGKYPKSKQCKKLFCGIDTSGSVGDQDLETFLGVVLDSLNYYNGLIIMQHDTHVHKVIEYDRKPNLNSLIEEIRKIYGRGGTSHRDIFNRLEDLLEENNDISTILFLTDFGSDVEHIFKDYKWIQDNDTIWVLNTSPSMGEVILDGCKTQTIFINDISKNK